MLSNLKQGFDRMHHCTKQSSNQCGSGMIVEKPIPMTKIGLNQVKYISKESLSNPQQGCDRIYHSAKQEDPNQFGCRKRVWKPISMTEDKL